MQVWQKLEEQNPDFFKAYITRLKLKDQINLFNHLLEQQIQVSSTLCNNAAAHLPVEVTSLDRGMTAPARCSYMNPACSSRAARLSRRLAPPALAHIACPAAELGCRGHLPCIGTSVQSHMVPSGRSRWSSIWWHLFLVSEWSCLLHVVQLVQQSWIALVMAVCSRTSVHPLTAGWTKKFHGQGMPSDCAGGAADGCLRRGRAFQFLTDPVARLLCCL